MPTHTPKIDIMKKIDLVDAELQTHEAVCAERYTTICSRLKRLEVVVMSTAGTIIILLLSVVYRS
jgi:hypothetical protein